MPKPIVYEFHRKDRDTSLVVPGEPPRGRFRDALRSVIAKNGVRHSFIELPGGRFRYTIKEQDAMTMERVLLAVDSTYKLP